ncbi:MAG: NYN domain-containing protein [bacterium]|nr:NYN domain-containing protein [bacterium]
MTILIDGFNLIYKFPDLEALMYQRELISAMQGLLEKVKEFQGITGEDITVIFDGKKKPSDTTVHEKAGEIDVYYSHDYSADYMIKELVKKSINPKMITVVSSDKEIIFYIKRFKAKPVTSEKFAPFLTKTVEEFHTPDIPEKEENPELSEEELEYWKDQFKKTDS